jgi:hypothetical protein
MPKMMISKVLLSWYVMGIVAAGITWVFMRADEVATKEPKSTLTYVKGMTLTSALVAGAVYVLHKYPGISIGGSLGEDVYLSRPDF